VSLQISLVFVVGGVGRNGRVGMAFSETLRFALVYR
jgi:hypothetical protein